MFRFACPACKAILQAPEQKAGARIACPKCGQRLQIPVPVAAAKNRTAPAPPPAAPSRSKPASPLTAQPVPAPRAHADAPPAASNPFRNLAARQPPARRKNRHGRALWLAATMLLLLAVAGALAVWLRPRLLGPDSNPAGRAATGSESPPTTKTRPTVVGHDSNRVGRRATASESPPTTKTRPKAKPPAAAADKSAKAPAAKTDQPPGDPVPEPNAPPPDSNADAKAPDGPSVDEDLPLADDLPRDLGSRVAEAINSRRTKARLDPVALDPQLSNGCRAHARYLARNAGRIPAQDEVIHDEDARLPGYTAAGLRTAKLATVAYQEPLSLVGEAAASQWSLLLRPGLTRMGAGFARNGRGQWVTVLDLSGGIRADARDVVIYPQDGQDRVPLAFPGNEFPDPIPDAKAKVAGYPITVMFRAGTRVTDVSAGLQDESNRTLDVWLSTPEKPANSEHAQSQLNTICLIARAPLKPRTTYTVRVAARADGQSWQWTWRFTTVDTRPAHVEVARALARINAYRRVAGLRPVSLGADLYRGCAAHARYIALNFDPRNPQALNLRDEDRRLPGSSDEGREAARLCSIRFERSLVAALDSMMASYDRAALDPSLKKVGLGYAPASTERFAASVIDFYSTRATTLIRAPVVLFPADKQRDVPLVYPAPDWRLLHPGGGWDPVAGYAITAGFPWGTPVSGVTARLTDGSGKEIACWVSTPEKPAQRGRPQNTVCLIPKAPLRPATSYTATVAAQVRRKPWKRTWTFSTVRHPELSKEEIETKVVEAVNAYRRLAGLKPVTVDAESCRACQAHARYLVRNNGHPSLQGLGMHQEDELLPGYTPEGRKAGQGSVITNDGTPGDSVAGWMATLYHRLPILNPRLQKIGFGYARMPGEEWMSVMDLRSGLGPE